MTRRINYRLTQYLFGALIVASLGSLQSARADLTILTVTNSNDGCFPNEPVGSLRAAIDYVNNAPIGGGPYVITFDSSLSGQMLLLGCDELQITRDVSILGPGPQSLAIAADGGQYRVFHIASTARVTILGVTVTNGTPTTVAGGGGILNEGSLTLRFCRVAGNDSTMAPNGGQGGGIYNSGPFLELDDCMLYANRAADGGGGLANVAGSATLNRCTLFDNDAGYAIQGGGGIVNYAQLSLINCTLCTNSVEGYQGGGIATWSGTLSLQHCTIAGNSCLGGGGGIHNFSTTPIYIQNTIVAGNEDNVVNEADVAGNSTPTVSNNDNHIRGFNLIGKVGSSTGWITFPTAGYDLLTTDPRLGPLQFNGGPSFTMALQTEAPASPAIDFGGDSSHAPPTDQRGLPREHDFLHLGNALRTGGDYSDIGAYEVQAPTTNDYYINLTGGKWETNPHWSLHTAPGVGNNAFVSFGALTGAIPSTVVFDDQTVADVRANPSWKVWNLTVGTEGETLPYSTLPITNNSLAHPLEVLYDLSVVGQGVVTVATNGALQVDSNYTFTVDGTVNLNGGDVKALRALVGNAGPGQWLASSGTGEFGELDVGYGHLGSCTNNGASITVTSLFMGTLSGAAGTYVNNGGSTTVSGGAGAIVGQSGIGRLLLNGGTFTADNVSANGSGSLIRLGGGAFSGNTTIGAGATLSGSGTVTGPVLIQGTAVSDGTGLSFLGAVINNSTMIADNGSTISFYGPVYGNGLFDARHGRFRFYNIFQGTGPILPVAPCSPGNALSFDGTNSSGYVSVPSAAALNLGSQFTIELWMSQTGADPGNGYRLIDKETSGTPDGYLLDTYDGVTGRKLRMAFGGTAYQASAAYTLNDWHHAAVTYNSGTLTFYLDGALNGSYTGVPAPAANTLDLRIGAPHVGCSGACGTVEYFYGSMDEVRIWNVARTQAQIQATMNRSLAGTETGLVAYWKFDEGLGLTVGDSSSQGNVGTLINGPLWVLSGALLRPCLQIARSPGGPVVSWAYPSTGFILQQSGKLPDANSWTSYGGTIDNNASTFNTTINPAISNAFFRLAK